MMVGVYSFVFSAVLKVKWSQSGLSMGTNQPYWLILLSGQFVFSLFADAIGKAPSLVVSVPNYVKKIIFPLETLPIVSFLVVMANSIITFIVLLILSIYSNGYSWTLWFTPLVFIPMALWCIGLGWLLGSIGVFFRDLQQVIPLLVQLLMFGTPIFYPLDMVPENLRIWLNINPLTPLVISLRDLMLWHRQPDCQPLIFVTLGGIVFAIGSYYIFHRLRQSFADVI